MTDVEICEAEESIHDSIASVEARESCPLCERGTLHYLGRLGGSLKFRCRACGWIASFDSEGNPA